MTNWSDVIRARNEGYDDGEIVDALARKSGKLDRVGTARKEGYSDSEILERLAPKLGAGKAAGIGVADALTLNTTDELAGAVRGTPDFAWAAVGGAPIELMFEPGREREGMQAQVEAANARGAATREGVRNLQDRARMERPGVYYGTQVGVGALTLPMSGGAKAATTAAGPVTRAAQGTAQAIQTGIGRLVPQPLKNAGAAVAGAVPAPVRAAAGDVLATSAQGARTGAAYGAAAGAGDARGGVRERTMGAIAGGGAGAGAGAVFGPAAKYTLGALGAIWREKFARDHGEKAMAMMIRRAREAGVSVDDLLARFYRGGDEAAGYAPRAAGDTVDETVGEMLGQGNKDLQIAMANVPGPGKATAIETFAGRGQRAGQRINRAFTDALKADGEDYYDTAKALKEKRKTEPAPLYDAAYAADVPEDVFSRAMFDAGADEIAPAFRADMVAAVDRAARRANSKGRGAVEKELRSFHQAISAGKPHAPLSVEAIDLVDRQIQQLVQKSRRDGLDEDAAMFTELQSALRAMDEATGLGVARSKAAAGFDAERALEEGRNAFKSGVDFEEISARLDGSTPEARQAYLQGIARGVYDLFANQRNMGGLADAATRVQGTELQRRKLMELLPRRKDGAPTAASARLLERLDREASMAEQAKMALGGSQTAPRQAAIDEASEGDTIDNIAALIAERLTGQGGNVGERAGRYLVDKIKRPGVRNESINRELASRSFATGRDEVVRVLKELRDFGARVEDRIVPQGPERFAARGAGRVEGQNAAAQSAFANDFDGAQADSIFEAFDEQNLADFFDSETTPDQRAELYRQLAAAGPEFDEFLAEVMTSEDAPEDAREIASRFLSAQ